MAEVTQAQYDEVLLELAHTRIQRDQLAREVERLRAKLAEWEQWASTLEMSNARTLDHRASPAT